MTDEIIARVEDESELIHVSVDTAPQTSEPSLPDILMIYQLAKA